MAYDTEQKIRNKIIELENIDYPIAQQSSTDYKPDTGKTDYSEESVWFQAVE